MINVVQMGLGPLGQKLVRFAAERDTLRVVAAVDPAPDKAGKALHELCDLDQPSTVTVSPVLSEAVRGKRAQVALIATVSSLQRLLPQIEQAAKVGLHVVSTCEELSHPWHTQPQLARKIDRLCKRHGVVCVGTGINPGFLMDYLPSVLSGVCQSVRRVVVQRVQDASSRRVPFQQKIGAGLARREFAAKVKAGTLRHVGLTESVYLVAQAMGWTLDRTTESLRPVIAEQRITSGYAPIEPGQAAGVEQIGRGYIGRREVIRLHFRAAVGEPQSHDTIEIDGSPRIISTIAGGVNGDIATCAITLNAAHSVLRAQPGLNTMLDLPAVTCRA
jgi:2,4-diaminopentanoate dehydrogenase